MKLFFNLRMVNLNMKKLCGLFFITIIALFSVCGCNFPGTEKIDPEIAAENEYIDSINQKLVSFSDYANDFSDLLEEMAEKTTIPTTSEIDNIESCTEKLSDICAQIQKINAPSKYTEAQALLNDSMQKYTDALSKCKELLDFYREYNTKIHSYDDPEEGGKELENQCRVIYSEFANMMQQATSEFRTAQAEFIN